MRDSAYSSADASEIALLRAEDYVFEAMLDGWRAQTTCARFDYDSELAKQVWAANMALHRQNLGRWLDAGVRYLVVADRCSY